MGERKLNQRIPVYTETRDRLRDFAYGGGVTYDVVLNFLLDNAKQPGEDDLAAGRRLRAAIEVYMAQGFQYPQVGRRD